MAIVVAYRIVGRLRPGPVNRGYRLGQLASGGLFALAHGTNDAQKTMGIITLALVATATSLDNFDVPVWVVVSSAAAIALGTYSAAGGSSARWAAGSSRWTRRRASPRRAPARR